MSNRAKIDKDTRKLVYDKYQGHCAYCGKPIEYKDMQVDHLYPVYLGGRDELENYIPACRACNFRKATMSVDKFREELKSQCERMLNTFQGKQSLAYGLIEKKDIDVVFYFEKV